jgi:hypothetical protein
MQPLPHILSSEAKRQRFLYLGLVSMPLGISWMNSWGIQISLWGCPFVKWIGIPCMGWGLTRSFYATATGDLTAAVNFHLFGPFLFLGFTIATVHWSVELLSGRSLQGFYSTWIQRQRYWFFGFLLILGYHFTRLITLHNSGTLQIWIRASGVGQWLSLN